MTTTTLPPIQSFAEENKRFRDGFNNWMIAKNWAPTTRTAYDETVRYLLEFMGSNDVSQADRGVLGAFISGLYARGLAPDSLNRHTFGLRAFYRFLNLAGATVGDPTRFIPQRKLPKRIPRTPTPDEIEKMLEAAKRKPHRRYYELRDRAVVELGYGAGLRVSEICSVKVADLDFGDGTVGKAKIVGKGDRERYAYFGSRAIAAIKAYLAEYTPESGFLFESVLGSGGVHRRGWKWWGSYYVTPREKTIAVGVVPGAPEFSRQKLIFRILKALRDAKTNGWGPERKKSRGVSRAKLVEISSYDYKRYITALRIHGFTISYNDNNQHPRYVLEGEPEPKFKIPDPLPVLATKEEARAELKRLIHQIPGAALYRAQPIRSRGIAYILKRLAEKARIPHVNPHALRHGFATALNEDGADIRYIQELLGHKNVSTTGIYLRTSFRKLKETHNQFHPHSEGETDETSKNTKR